MVGEVVDDGDARRGGAHLEAALDAQEARESGGEPFGGEAEALSGRERGEGVGDVVPSRQRRQDRERRRAPSGGP